LLRFEYLQSLSVRTITQFVSIHAQPLFLRLFLSVIGINSSEWKSVAAKLFLNLKFLLVFDVPLQTVRRRKVAFNDN